MGYKVESEFEHEGLKCVVVMTTMGHRCGYVGLSKEYVLYGKDYSDRIGKFSDIKNKSTEKMNPINIISLAFEDLNDDSSVRIDCYVDVHGGITYSGGGEKSTYPIESDLWWFGYDCAHCDDAKDLSAIENEEVKKIEMMYPTRGIIRTLDYCIDECKCLAEQLNKLTL